MACSSGPNVVKDGLVFYYDMNNTKSYSKNIFPHPTDIYSWVQGGQGCTLSRDYITSPVGGTPLKMVVTGNDPYTSSYNNSSWNLASTKLGDVWTISVWVKADRSTTCQVFGFESNDVGGYSAAPSTTHNIDTTWKRVSHTYTINNSATTKIQTRLDGTTNGTTGATIWWDGLQIEHNGVTTEFSNLSNPNGSAVKDLMGTNTITNNSLKYNNDGSFEFDGSTQDVYVNNFPQIWNGSVTMEGMFYFTTSNTRDILFGCYNSTPGVNFERDTGDRLRLWWNNGVNNVYSPNGVVPANQWLHVVMIRNKENSSFDFYVNGGLVHQQTVVSTDISSAPSLFRIGRDSRTDYTMCGGKIPSLKIYNKALNANEVKNNFNAIRGRFGL